MMAGYAALFYGCRYPDQDFIYHEEFAMFSTHGIVEPLTTFSRVEGQGRVHQRIREQQKNVLGAA